MSNSDKYGQLFVKSDYRRANTLQLDEDEIRNSEIDAFLNKDKSAALTPLTIFFAVLAAIVVAWLMKTAYDDWQAREAMRIFEHEWTKFEKQMNKNFEQSRVDAENLLKRQTQQLNNQVQRIRSPRLEKLVEEQQQEYRKEKVKKYIRINGLDVTNNTDKAKAWAEYYKPSANCEKAENRQLLMECRKSNLQAIKEFEAIWGGNN
jgi:hypothetical protein